MKHFIHIDVFPLRATSSSQQSMCQDTRVNIPPIPQSICGFEVLLYKTFLELQTTLALNAEKGFHLFCRLTFFMKSCLTAFGVVPTWVKDTCLNRKFVQYLCLTIVFWSS